MNLAELSIKRPIFITSIVILMLILGTSSLTKMSVDMFPDVTFPIVFVQTIYPGAAPLDMERQVSKIIEDELGNMAGLNKMTTTNSESISVVVMEFKIGTDIKDSEQQIRQRLGNIRRKLPTEIKEPIIRRFDPADLPVVQLAVTSELPPAELYDITDQIIKPKFETLPGVGQVTITGGRKRQIDVFVNKDKAQERNISLGQIADKISKTSKDVPIGKIETPEKETIVRASGEFRNLEDLKKVNVQFLGSDQVVTLDTLAEVKEGLEEAQTFTSFSSRNDNYIKKPSIFLEIYKQSGANTVKVVETVQINIEKANSLLKEKGLNVKVQSLRDTARPIRINIADVRESIFIGIILLIVVVFFFLGSFRSTFITAMALPNSLLGGFILMYMMGFSINVMTLMALSLAVGLLVDDAIVVRENIFRHMELGQSPKDAAIMGTKEVAQAVLATTLVVIAVFGPIAFLEGIVGQFFKQFGLTVVFTMLISLFDAFTVAPMLSAYMASPSEHKKGNSFFTPLLEVIENFHSFVEKTYMITLRYVIHHRLITLSIAFLVFIASLALVKLIPKTFMPNHDNGEFMVTIERPIGSSLESTKKFTERVEEEIKKNSSVELMTSTIGAASGQAVANKASIYVRLIPKAQRKFVTSDVKQQFRESFVRFQSEAQVQVGDIDIVGSGMKAFNVNISGDDLESLSAYVEKLKKRVEQIPGLVDVDTNYRTGKPELQIVFDRKASESLGVSTVTAGGELRARTEGIEAATFRKNGLEYPILVRLRDEDRDLKKEFSTTLVPNINFNMVPLHKVSSKKDTFGYSQINRQDKSRYVNLAANLGIKGNLGDISNEVERLLKEDPEYKLPSGMSYRFMGQAQDFRDLMNNMLMAMALGISFIFLVLASLYESFITPFTILLALPLAITGAFILLLMTGKSIDLFSMIGIIMLLGVVAKNSILFVDYAHQKMDEGIERSEALLLAGQTRLRPILMTSFALIAGTFPIAIGLNEASAQRTSMGVAIIGGLISSTFLTLVVVPAAFEYIDDFRIWLRGLFARG